MSSWTYSDRHTCQEIVPGLWLGPHTVGRNQAYLQSLHVTDIVLVKANNAAENASLSERFPTEFRYHTVCMSDTATETAVGVFLSFDFPPPESFRTVLVLGSAGMNRSAALVAAILIRRNLADSAESAIDLVMSHKGCVAVSDSLRRQLAEFADIWAARSVDQNLNSRKFCKRLLAI